MSAFLWVRAYEDILVVGGQRTLGWNTLYQGYEYSKASDAARPAIAAAEWVILDSQYPGNPQWEPRVIWSQPSVVEGMSPELPPVPATTKPSHVGAIVGVIVAAVAGFFGYKWLARKT